MRTRVTYTDDSEPELIVAQTGEFGFEPTFEMEGSTAVFAGPAFAQHVESAADAVEQLPFVQAVEVGE